MRTRGEGPVDNCQDLKFDMYKVYVFGMYKIIKGSVKACNPENVPVHYA